MTTFRRPDRTSPLPLWAQVLDDLKARLARGEFDRAFPPERELIEQYEVSRHTVREAIRRLHTAGVIERERGRGTFLRESLEQQTGVLYSLFRSIEEQGFEQRSKVLDLRITNDENAAGHLGLAADAELLYLRRVRHADATPIATDELWMPAALTRPLLEADFEHTALYTELEARCGLRPGAGWERVHAELPTAEERKLLAIPARQAIFVVERYTEARGQTLEWRRTAIRADHYSFLTRWGDGTDGEPAGATAVVPRGRAR